MRDGKPVITVPKSEVDLGTLTVGETYRVAILSHNHQEDTTPRESTDESWRTPGPAGPPVEEGDSLAVEIEDVGDQGDGIARVGPGYVVFVPGSDVGDRITVQITRAEENFAFAAVVEDDPVSEDDPSSKHDPVSEDEMSSENDSVVEDDSVDG